MAELEDEEILQEHLLEYRAESQRLYDTYLITLSGGGLAVSLSFVHDIIRKNPIVDRDSLVWAWSCWLASIVCIILSFLTARFANEKAYEEIKSTKRRRGGWLSWATDILNFIAGVLFVLGTVHIIVFASQNLEGLHNAKTTTTAETTNAAASTTPKTS